MKWMSFDPIKDDKPASRFVFYVALGVATLLLLFAARILGMPRGLGITQEPHETGEPEPPAQQNGQGQNGQ